MDIRVVKGDVIAMISSTVKVDQRVAKAEVVGADTVQLVADQPTRSRRTKTEYAANAAEADMVSTNTVEAQ